MSKNPVFDTLSLPLTQLECAQRLGMTRRQVEIIEKRALSKLAVAARLEGLAFEDFVEALSKGRMGYHVSY